MKKFEKIIFDLDGTLINSIDILLDVDQSFFSRYGITLSEGDFEKMHY